MIAFGLAEVATGLTHSFLGLVSTTAGAGSTVGGVGIGSLYFVGGVFLLAQRRWTIAVTEAFLILVVLGRMSFVILGLYPVNSFRQVFSISLGTAIATFLAIYVGMAWWYFREGH